MDIANSGSERTPRLMVRGPFAPKGVESSLVSETTKDLPEDALVASQIGEAGQFAQPMPIGHTVSVIGVE